MEATEPQFRQFSFTGKGGDMFKIYIVNWLLTIVTFGLYYPWAKASILKYKYQNTFFDGSNFVFHGTGKEMFKGFIKVFAVIIVFYGLLIFGQLFLAPAENLLLFGVFYVVLLLIIPLAIHGSIRYRSSRSSWRGIYFGYRGNKWALFKQLLLDMFLTIITLGIYGSWMIVNLQRYVLENARFGNIKFEFTGDGLAYFFLRLKGSILTMLTLGIYYFWYRIELYEYLVENIYASQDGKSLPIRTTAKGGDFFVLSITNFFLLIITLGFAIPWVETRTINFFVSHLWVEGDFNAEALSQTEAEYKDAAGEDALDFFDIDLI